VRKRVKGKKLNRNAAQRRALSRGLLTSLIQLGQIKTTLAKAKVVRPQMEKLVTAAKKNDLAARRRLLAAVPQKEMVKKMIEEIVPRFQNRHGGYLRIVKLGPRAADGAEMARLEFVEKEQKEKSKK